MLVRINVGPITDPKTEMIDDSMTLADAIARFNLNGELTLNGSSLSTVDKRKTLKELGIAQDDYLCSARKNGGNN